MGGGCRTADIDKTTEMEKLRKSPKRIASPSVRTPTRSKRMANKAKSDDSTPGTKVHIDGLPIEILCHLLGFLTLSERLKLATVSRRWQEAVNASLARCRHFSKEFIPWTLTITDRMLEKILSRLPGLRSLKRLSGTDLDANIICRHCPQLVDVSLDDFRVDVPSLERLCRSCPKLAALTLPDTCDDACVETVLRGLPELRSLRIDLTELTGQCLALLPASLQRLELCGDWDLRPASVGWAARCPALTELDISCLEDAPSGWLSKLLDICPRLERLNAKDREITDAFIKQLPNKTPAIRHLNLAGCGDLTAAGLKSLGRLKELRTLDLFDTNSTDAVLKELEGAFHLTKLVVGPDLYHGTPFSEKGLARLVKSCPSLKKVVATYGIELDKLLSQLVGQLSADRDVTLVVADNMLDDLDMELPEDGPLRLETYSEEDDDDD